MRDAKETAAIYFLEKQQYATNDTLGERAIEIVYEIICALERAVGLEHRFDICARRVPFTIIMLPSSIELYADWFADLLITYELLTGVNMLTDTMASNYDNFLQSRDKLENLLFKKTEHLSE